MNSCGKCGDRWPDTEVHSCWLQAKLRSQENLPLEEAPEYLSVWRGNLSDAEWRATREQ